MSNQTRIPALQARVGDWDYHICKMKFADVAQQVSFAHELSGNNQELSTLIEYGLSKRAAVIKDYLLTSEQRFLEALIVAVWGGSPKFTPLLTDGQMGPDSSPGFGMLTLDGTQKYFALSGQDRLRAIKDAVADSPALGDEEVCVFLLPHYDTAEYRQRIRRLLTDLNRNAKVASPEEKIVFDEDDGFAIVTRQLITEHPFLSTNNVIKVAQKSGPKGIIKLASNRLAPTEPRAWTTLSVLYDCVVNLGPTVSGEISQPLSQRDQRPDDQTLQAAYEALSERIEDLLKNCGNLREKLEHAQSARDVRAPRGAVGDGHPFMRPVVQKAVTKVLGEICINQPAIAWEELMRRLRTLDWRMAQPPWLAVFDVQNGIILSGTGMSDLLKELLHVHLAPSSRDQIRQARETFRSQRGMNRVEYGFTEEQLAQRLPLGSR